MPQTQRWKACRGPSHVKPGDGLAPGQHYDSLQGSCSARVVVSFDKHLCLTTLELLHHHILFWAANPPEERSLGRSALNMSSTPLLPSSVV